MRSVQPPNSSLVIAASYVTGVAGTAAEFMVPPVLPIIHQHLGGNSAVEGLLMGGFAVAALAAALAAGRLAARWGTTAVAMGGLWLLAVGTGLEWVSFRQSALFGFLLFRFATGAGFGFISVSAPAKIGQEVDARLLPRAMGIWATWVPVGSLLMFAVGPHLMTQARIAPLIVAQWILDGAAFLLMSRTGMSRAKTPMPRRNGPPHGGWRGPIVMVSVAFALMTFQVFSFSTWLTTWFTGPLGIGLSAAGMIGAAASGISAVGNLCAGWVIGRFGSRAPIFVAASLMMAASWLSMPFRLLTVAIVAAAVVNFFSGGIATLVFSAPNWVAQHADDVGHAMSLVIVGENLGIAVGPVVFSLVLGKALHFTSAFWLLAGVAVLMAAALAGFFQLLGIRSAAPPLEETRG